MAELVSPGVSITVSDESFSTAAGAGTVPLVVIATAQDKASPDGAGIAAGTTAAEAGNVKLVTSQRDLLTNFGNPTFKTSGGTPLPGHELNEYGLFAAYSFLGIANRAYVLRADVDLDQLEASATAPTAPVDEGSYWVDFNEFVTGLKRWDGSKWVQVTDILAPAPSAISNSAPVNALGKDGQLAVVFIDGQEENTDNITVWEKQSGVWYKLGDNANGFSGDYQVARSTQLPLLNSTGGALSVGDYVWQMNEANSGNKLGLKIYQSGQWVSVDSEGYEYSYQVNDYFDALGGATSTDVWKDFNGDVAELTIRKYHASSQVQALSASAPSVSATGHSNGTVAFSIIVNDRDIVNGNSGVIDITFAGYDTDGSGTLDSTEILAAINDGLSAANVELTEADNLSAFGLNDGRLRLVETRGRNFRLEAGNVAGFSPSNIGFVDDFDYSAWDSLETFKTNVEPTGSLADGTLWYDSLVSTDRIDILENDPQNGWVTYTGDVNIAASTPSLNSEGNALVAGDLWVDSSDLENYPQIYKWSGSAWALVDNTDQESSDGIVFDDFRVSTSAGLNSDAPQATLYPYNILAWNKQVSGGNVKKWNATQQRWDDYSGNKPDGSPYMLRKAQRRAVVRELQAVISSNTEIRNEANRFNLISVPGYPELLDEMIELNTDRKETAFIVGDAPLRLSSDASSLQNWATNANNALENGEDGLVSSSPYAAVYYPHGLASNLDGTNVVVPASHIALRTLAFNDQVAFPWFAPAGFQRGVVTNASSVGYIDADSGEFQSVALSEGQRDSLYINKINPIGQFPGRGLAVFGQKTLNPSASALDRVNVARLVVFIRERLDDLVRPFLFEPNDEVTRQNAKVLVDRFLGNLVSQRGLFDFVVVCDSSNNTPERIDRNELHIDIAIQPVKAVEFIYIPIRVQNTLGQTN